jgi:hypothetical protein
VEQPALTPQQFVDRLAELDRAKRRKAATQLVYLYPDIAIAVLREPSSVNASPEVMQIVAQARDRHAARTGSKASWSTLYEDRAREPQKYATHDKKRSQFIAHLQNGKTQAAMELGLAAPQGAPGTMLQIDVQYLKGIAHVLGDRPREGGRALAEAARMARSADPYQAASLLLLLSDAQRRSGDNAGAEATWREAAELASDLAAAPVPLTDPILWERIAYLRPANSPWPTVVEQRLVEINVQFGIAAAPRPAGNLPSSADSTRGEAALWTSIGHWRLAREECQAALVALKRAESMTSDPTAASLLRLSQAKALARLGQAPAATAMLMALAGESNTRISRPAMALLGALKLQQGSTQQGFNLLHRAVEEDLSLAWPERTQAEADLGLAYLVLGEEGPGLQWLHTAQAGFESTGQIDHLVRCLENEAAYLEQANKKDLANAVRRRLELLQTG